MEPLGKYILTGDWVYDSLLLMSVMKADDVIEYTKPRRFGFFNANFRGFFLLKNKRMDLLKFTY